MKKYVLACGLLLASVAMAWAQTEITISGTLRDQGTGETLIAANVFVPSLTVGTTTNVYGFYSLRVPQADSVTLQFSYTGYQTVERRVPATADIQIDLELVEGEQLTEIVVSAESNKEELNTTQMSVTKLSTKVAKQLPALFGEVDIIKTLQLKPGIQSGGEGTSGLLVRGGGVDQNLFVLDEATVYNASHLFGFFSTFNADAVKNVELYKGGFPAEYGGRLSSVIDVRLRDGNRKEFKGTGGLGLIASRLTLEGPIVKDKGSFIVSGRRTYVDIITNQVNRAQSDNANFNPIPDYYFYDFNAKLNYDITDKDKIFVSTYLGRDFFDFGNEDFKFLFEWGNQTVSTRWNHVFNSNLFMNTTLTYSDYDYTLSNEFSGFNFELGSGIEDLAAKVDFSYTPNNDHYVQFGVSATRHNFDIGRANADSESGIFEFSAGQQFTAYELGAYIADEWEVNDKLKLDYGLRLSGFSNDSTFYYGIEPRMAAKYSLNDRMSLKGSYARMYQYIHLVSNSGASLPTDVWYPSDRVVAPQYSDQVALGISIALGKDYLLSNEIYHKWLWNQVDFRDNANLFVNDNLNQEFVFGKGTAYGNEIYLEKKNGKLTGWIGYTLSWSWREFPDILDGRRFPYRFDRRHDASIVASYEINKHLTVTGSWVYSTGNATTVPEGYFIVQGTGDSDFRFIPIYVDRNSYRMPAYHRMDLGLVWKFDHKWGKSDLTFSVYNAYDRRNPYFLYVDDNRAELIENNGGTFNPADFQNLKFEARQVSLFPILPSVTWNFEF